MKSYIIKSKEGLYLSKYYNYDYSRVDGYYKRVCWTNNLLNAKIFKKEPILKNESDCEVIEITIAEGDLEQQLAEKDKKIEELKTKLETAEYWNKKYDNAVEEIEELKFEKRNLSGLVEKVSSKGQQEIRHQVCEEIKDWINTHCAWNEVGHIKDLYWSDLNRSLYEIEQGESK